MADLVFLTIEDITEIHADLIESYGGSTGIRDLAGLESAISQVQATFDGKLLHQSLFEMASAYIFHLSSNHPFLDGNKRVALASGLIFLELNGVTIEDPTGTLYPFMIEVASGRKQKPEISALLSRLASS